MLLLPLPARIDIHVLVKEPGGSFDFVFSDADKGWYKNSFIDIDPNLRPMDVLYHMISHYNGCK